jgi:hypothetical protein
MLPNPSPNEGGFFLIQNAMQPGRPGSPPFFTPSPAQPTSSRLSSYSDSHFSFAAFDQVVNSSLISPSNTGINLVNGSYYVAFDVKDQANANAVYYGWMNVTASGIDTLSTVTFTLNEWAYDNTGASIKVGQVSAVPEPAAWALMFAGVGLLLARRSPARSFKPLPAFPSTSRDVAMIVPESTTHDAILAAIRQAKPANLESVNLFDIFRGRHVPDGQKSVAYSFTYRAADRTLRDDEVNATHQRVVDAFKNSLKAAVRE